MSLFYPSLTQATDNNGNPVSGAQWRFYLTGTTTPANVYANADNSTSLGATVTADAAGWFVPIFLDDGITYRAILRDAGGTQIGGNDINPVNGVEGGASIDTLQTQIDVLDGRVDALEAGVGTSSLFRQYPRPKRWSAPTGINNPLGLSVDCDGRKYGFNGSPADLADWSTTETGITHYFIDYVNGLDTNAGTSPGSGNAWKTYEKAKASAVDKSIIHFMDRRVGYNSQFSGSPAWGTRRVKLIGEHPDGPTIFSCWTETYTAAFMSWTADGSAYKSTAAVSGDTIRAMGDYNYCDPDGAPLAMPHVASLATCKTTPGSWNWDGTTLSVNMIDGRVPDPNNGWLPVPNLTNHNTTTNADIAFENCLFAFNYGVSHVDAFYLRPLTVGVANTIRVSLKNCVAFGASGNGFQVYDVKIAALENCSASHCYADCFNYSSFISTSTQAQWMTVYEYNCAYHDAGYLGWRTPFTISNSNNGSTAHRGIHVWRVNTRGYNIPNASIAEVQGCYSFNCGVQTTQSTLAGGLWQANFFSQKNAGEGSTGSKMVLIGCVGDSIDASKYHVSTSDDLDGGATLGEIHISDWLGTSIKSKTGAILKNYETGATL